MIITEQKKLRQVRTLYANQIEKKTNLEQILRQCVDDVKAEIALKRSQNKVLYYNQRATTAKGRRKQAAEEDLTAQEREKIIEVLLSQERVLTLLYDKTFPPKMGAHIRANLNGKSEQES